MLGAEPYPDVRQSAFELLGDLCRACASHLVPRAGDILTLVTHNMSAEVASMPQNLSACNNACWAAGELVVRWLSRPGVQKEVNSIPRAKGLKLTPPTDEQVNNACWAAGELVVRWLSRPGVQKEVNSIPRAKGLKLTPPTDEKVKRPEPDGPPRGGTGLFSTSRSWCRQLLP